MNAQNIFKEGLRIDNNNIALNNNLAMSYKNLLNYTESEKLFKEIIKNNKNYINAYVNLGNLKRDLNKFDEAIELYKKALSINNKNPIILYSLALAHQGMGQFDLAINYAKKTLEINSNFTRADNLISQSMKYTKNNPHYISIKQKIKKNELSKNERIELYFAISKAEEDMNNIKEATENLIEGNKLKKSISTYDLKIDFNLFDDIKKLFDSEQIINSSQKNNDNIIFILGMPRSGTSLIEQIISSHSDVFGCGELPILTKIIKENFFINGSLSNKKFQEIFNQDHKIESLKKNYLEFIKNFDFKEKFITDKAPLNFRWIGFIKMLFPNSKIIHCKRDAKNNCLSIYKNLFEGGLNFSYDQEDLVKYFKKYEDLMLFWKSKYKNFIYEIEYENLINNNKNEIKKIVNFCNLEWQENCLSFHNNKNPIKTMSTAQARKPIYKTSLKSFDRYKDFLKYIDNNL